MKEEEFQKWLAWSQQLPGLGVAIAVYMVAREKMGEENETTKECAVRVANIVCGLPIKEGNACCSNGKGVGT